MLNKHIDKPVSVLLMSIAVLCGLILLLVLSFLVKEAWPAINDGAWRSFLVDDAWYPLEGLFGISPMILASLAMTVGAILLALPLGVSSAIFLVFYAPAPVSSVYRLMLNLLAGFHR